MTIEFENGLAGNEQMTKTLNNIAVEYFRLGLKKVSYQIWDGLYHAIKNNLGDYKGLMPVVSCNLGNALRCSSHYGEAYMVCRQGLKYCFDTDEISAMPELILQIAVLSKILGNVQNAKCFYTLGKEIFFWSRHMSISCPLDEMAQKNFLMYY